MLHKFDSIRQGAANLDFFQNFNQSSTPEIQLFSLNEQQEAAVRHGDGPALVLAGPGSGKTTVLTARAAYLCIEKGADPKSILNLTFSRSAAADMRDRFENLFSKSVTGESFEGNVTFSTLHSFCNRVVRNYERMQGHTLRRLESEEESAGKERILREIYKNVYLSRLSDDDLDILKSDIGVVKNRMIRDLDAFPSSIRNFRLIY